MNQFSDKIIILTAPSGAGKTSITRYLLGKYDWLSFSVSAATRPARAGETNGKDYHFMSVDQFREHIRNNDFIEWEMVYEGKYYGTLRSEIEKIWRSNRIPVLDIDVKGAIHVQQQFPQQSLSIFIEPPSVEELRRRLESRGTETADTLEARVNKAAYEISFKNHFDCIVVNDNLETACRETETAIMAFIGGSPEKP